MDLRRIGLLVFLCSLTLGLTPAVYSQTAPLEFADPGFVEELEKSFFIKKLYEK